MLPYFIFLLLSGSLLFSEEKNHSSPAPLNIDRISEALGYLLGEKLHEIGLPYDLHCIVKGLEKAAKEKQTPLTKEHYLQAINIYIQEIYREIEKKNLIEAEDFLKTNANNKNIIEVIPGKLQYQTIKDGTGTPIQPHQNLIIKYTGKYLDGTIFCHSEETILPPEELFIGFSESIKKMQKGEKRLLFIHPELGKSIRKNLSPNALLTFEIELLEINASPVKNRYIPNNKEIAEEKTHTR